MAKGHFKVYKRIPDAPSFSSPVTITAAILLANHSSVPGAIFPSDMGAATDCILSGPFPLGIVFNGFTSGLTYRFKNLDATTIIGTASLTDHSIQNLNGSTNIEIYSKSHDEPIILMSLSSGVAWRASSGGNRMKCVGLVGRNIGYALFLRTTNVPSFSYAVIDDSYCSIDGLVTDGEGEYSGYNTSGFSPVDSFSCVHIIIKNKGREGFQVTHNTLAYGNKMTALNVGNSGIAGQGNLCQVHDSNGTWENFVFYGAPTPCNHFAHGFTYRNGIFCWSVVRGFIGLASSFYAGSPRLNGVEVLFDTCEFLPLFGGADYFAEFHETGCNFRFLNCTRPASMTGFLWDQRSGGFSNSIIETGTIIATPSTPVFDARGRIADSHNYFLHRGGFTP